MFKITVINEYDNIVVFEVLNIKDDRESFEANIDYEFQKDGSIYSSYLEKYFSNVESMIKWCIDNPNEL